MKAVHKGLIIWIPAALILGALITFAILGYLFTAIAVFISIALAVILQGLRKIPADPPHVALLTVWGERTAQIKKEGWRLFLLYDLWRGFILVSVKKENLDLKPQNIRTPDNAPIEIPVSITWTPAWKVTEVVKDSVGNPVLDSAGKLQFTTREAPGLVIEFLNSGRKAGVEEILEDIVQERLREWARSEIEGPQTWEEAMAANEEAAAILLKAVLGEALQPISSTIPTAILLKYFAKPRKDPSESEADKWGENWAGVEQEVNKLSKEDREKLEKAVEQRRTEITKARQGNGYFTKSQLGIVINRLNIGEIKVLGETAKAAELFAKEKLERKAEVLELEHVRAQIAELMKMGYSKEQALEIVQTERSDKVKKEIKELKLNVSPETRDMLEKTGGLNINIVRSGEK